MRIILRRPAQWWRGLSPRARTVTALGGTAAVLALIALLALFPDGEEPRARQYLDSKACLLTSADGVADPEAAPIWAALQKASAETKVKVQYLAATGPSTVANTRPFLGTLITLDCDLTIAVGPTPTRTVTETAPSHPSTRFAVINTPADRPNVTTVSADPAHLSTAIHDLLTSLTNND